MGIGLSVCLPFAYLPVGVLVLLDCSKAFDRMNRAVLICHLHRGGFHGRLFEAIVGFFCGRRQRVKVNQTLSDFARTHNGGPQGSVITLYCWLLYINTLAEEMGDTDFALFVDDVAFWDHDTDPTRLISRVNGVLERIYSGEAAERRSRH